EKEDFDQMQDGFNFDLAPEGAVQQTLFEEIVGSAWQMRRIRVSDGDGGLLRPRHIHSHPRRRTSAKETRAARAPQNPHRAHLSPLTQRIQKDSERTR